MVLAHTHARAFFGEQRVATADWEQYVGGIAADILKEQTPACLLKVRGKLYELLTNCIPADVIIKTLEKALSTNLDDSVRHAMAQAAAYYEHRLCMGRKVSCCCCCCCCCYTHTQRPLLCSVNLQHVFPVRSAIWQDIYHLEGFVAKFMAVYKKFVCEQSQMMAEMGGWDDDFE